MEVGIKMEMDERFCPLCGAHQLEWYEGEETDGVILEFGQQIEDLYEKYQILKKNNE